MPPGNSLQTFEIMGSSTTNTYNVGPPVDSVQLVNITPISLWFMVFITIVFMGFLLTNVHITGEAHIVQTHFSKELGRCVIAEPPGAWVPAGSLDNSHVFLLKKCEVSHLMLPSHQVPMKWLVISS